MSLVQRTVRLVTALFFATGLLAASAPARADEAVIGFVPTINLPGLTAVPGSATASVVAPSAAFASLAAAVAAQDGLVGDEHLRCLASAVYFESQGEPLAGQIAVARVILNRIRSGRFAADVCGVVKQRGQFGFVRGGAIPPVPESRATWRTAIAVAKVALADAWAGVSPDALYFNGVRAARVGSRRIAVIGRHAFYR